MSGQLCLATCSICPILDFNISGSTGCRIFTYVCCCTCISLWRQWTSTWCRWSCCVLLVQLKKQFSVWAWEQKAEPPHTHYRLFVQSVISLQSSLHCSPFMRRACISSSSHSLQPMLSDNQIHTLMAAFNQTRWHCNICTLSVLSGSFPNKMKIRLEKVLNMI